MSGGLTNKTLDLNNTAFQLLESPVPQNPRYLGLHNSVTVPTPLIWSAAISV